MENNTVTREQIIERIRKWAINHPDVWQIVGKDEAGGLQGTEVFWWVQNAIGDITGWDEEVSKALNNIWAERRAMKAELKLIVTDEWQGYYLDNIQEHISRDLFAKFMTWFVSHTGTYHNDRAVIFKADYDAFIKENENKII